MTNILNAQEAFTALRSGKTILCRHILGEFDSLDQFPATVFGLPDHEYCIKIETIELAGITFTKPLTLEEVQPEQDVFLIQPQAVILQYKFNENIEGLVAGIRSGFAQRDFENAKRQYEALCSAVGGSIFEASLEIAEQPKKKRTSKKQNDANEVKQLDAIQPANDNSKIDEILGPASGHEFPSSNSLADASQSESDLDDFCHQVNFDDLLSKIKLASNESDVHIYRRTIRTNNIFTDEQLNELEAACEARLTDLSLDEFESNQVKEAIIENKDRFASITQAALDKAAEISHSEYEKNLSDLINRAKHAQSPAETNALTKYTSTWTIEQREPLLKVINQRLLELSPPLTARIREAQSLAILNTFLSDIESLEDRIYANDCMQAYAKRKAELTDGNGIPL
ncbi:hypothetical protein HMP0015_2427 [Acinetobacter haemolyticus ATCC 19194]|uniref:Uncharacterized protein n=1 Tax=Acinetobacter haemolyticus ATCC 19194 TaxID=707232 RepID=D4XRT5_ACIHA|nr:hypothetical protein [Acinetobacter haemolyticus]EFF82145.1 hypothetical protein HMP0015_2427 [Acinetobacter haemolyticus ATCC 19194]